MKIINNFYKIKRGKYGVRGKCKACVIRRTSRYRRKLKLEILNYYGKICACCGESAIEFLTIDHIDGGGTVHRKQMQRYGCNFYVWLIMQGFPKGYRILCFNCNCSLGYLDYCPHKTKRDWIPK